MLRIVRLLLPFVLSAVALAQTGAAQHNGGPMDQPAATLKLTTRLVYVDVVVHDRSGQVVKGLTEQDFKLEEDGRAQKVDFFAVHTYDAAIAAQAKRQAASAEHGAEFSNMPEQGAVSGAINIILFDELSTPPLDQPYARRQLLKFLLALPAGQQTALFILSDRLHMLQSFTGSSDQLQEAAKQINPRDFSLMRSQTEVMQDNDFAAPLTARLGEALAQEDQVNFNRRAEITIWALEELARATSGYAGRKNLLWLSESFPFEVGPQFTESEFHESVNLPGEQEAANLIASTQIAVYPISLLGLEAGGVPSAVRGGQASSMGGVLQGQFDSRASLKYTLNDLADRTGGESFMGTNDFAEALRRSMLDGSNYYTLAYRPTNQKWNGQFRKIQVKLANGHGTLNYRRGYFADPDTPPAIDSAQELHFALQPETPEYTMLALRSRVQLPDAQHSALRVDSVLDASNVEFATTADGKRHAQLMVLLIALNDGPQQVAAPPQSSGVLKLDLMPDQYKIALTSGVPIHLELDLKPGKYRLRLGVSDMATHNLGTLDMPVNLSDATPASH